MRVKTGRSRGMSSIVVGTVVRRCRAGVARAALAGTARRRAPPARRTVTDSSSPAGASARPGAGDAGAGPTRVTSETELPAVQKMPSKRSIGPAVGGDRGDDEKAHAGEPGREPRVEPEAFPRRRLPEARAAAGVALSSAWRATRSSGCLVHRITGRRTAGRRRHRRGTGGPPTPSYVGSGSSPSPAASASVIACR